MIPIAEWASNAAVGEAWAAGGDYPPHQPQHSHPPLSYR
jgi:hypothetical protein